MIEAKCRRCGGHFNPTGEEATQQGPDGEVEYEHYTTDDGEDCGGFGPVVGEWS